MKRDLWPPDPEPVGRTVSDTRAVSEPPTFRFDDSDDLPMPVVRTVREDGPSAVDPVPSPAPTFGRGFGGFGPPVEESSPSVADGVGRAERRRRQEVTVAGWLGFVAWVVFSAGASLADASRPGFRVVTGLDRMFAVTRGSGGDPRLASYAGVLFVFASAIGLLGVFAAVATPRRRVPWPAVLALCVSAIALVFFRP